MFRSDEKRGLEELFDLMELPIARRKHWWARVEAHRKLWAENYKGQSTCEVPCDFRPVRYCDEWGDDELVIPAYADDADAAGVRE